MSSAGATASSSAARRYTCARGLVCAGELRGEDRVEAQVAVAGEVDEQRDVPVGQRRRHAVAPQQLEAVADVGPGVELVPAADEPRLRGVVDGRQAARGEQLVERRAVQLVERRRPGAALGWTPRAPARSARASRRPARTDPRRRRRRRTPARCSSASRRACRRRRRRARGSRAQANRRR